MTVLTGLCRTWSETLKIGFGFLASLLKYTLHKLSLKEMHLMLQAGTTSKYLHPDSEEDMGHVMRKPTMWFLNRSERNHAI